MSLLTWILFFLLQPSTPASTAPTKHFSPPPLNPHPKEALHVTVSFDRPEDASRYTVAMKARYWNQQRECGYVEPDWNRRFVYPEGIVDIPNQSRRADRAEFDIYLDRYIRGTCSWEFASPDFTIRDTYTGIELTGDWGLRDDLNPGAEYRAICPFRRSKYSKGCFGRHPVPDSPWHNQIPAENRIPITVRVSQNSTSLRQRVPGFFDNFLEPVTPSEPTSSASPSETHL
ncbi:hypothetical protein [Luteibacter sp. 329MFSha]|uniref:hypothetical protein n=1 Tax=Luteibacter sp. 329MFSha TaxID=1798239 RepID=UPI0008D07615|nr:hypothetical protein [Luteibacter sp. 329MFSha]SEV84467.1 hypothetical protein SAMN04515660_0196 [Luteibacter sp. 329MFSha]